VTLKVLLTATAIGLAWPVLSVQAGDLDIAAELQTPGVKLVVVEFFAGWCEPCMKAAPKWKELHRKYAAKGLRFIVVMADDGVCEKPVDWSPDVIRCDADGALQARMGVSSLPTSFLYSWEGKLALKSHFVEPIEQAIRNYFNETHYTIEVLPVEVFGDKYAVSGNPEWVRDEVVSRIKARSKFDVVSERDTRPAKSPSDVCPVGLPANSSLRIRLRGFETGERMLSLELEKDGCVEGKAAHPYQGQGFVEDRDSLRRAAQRAVEDLLGQVVRIGKATVGEGGELYAPYKPQGGEEVVVNLESDPPGMKIFSRGVKICEATPCRSEIAPGRRVFEFRSPDGRYENQTLAVDVQRRMKPVKATMQPTFARLDIRSTPPRAEVRIDGEYVGETALLGEEVGEGWHKIEVGDETYVKQWKEIKVSKGDREELSFALQARQGGLKVKARDERGQPLEGEVYVDGEKIGYTGQALVVAVGEHMLAVTSETKEAIKKVVTIREGQTETVEVSLSESPPEPEPAWEPEPTYSYWNPYTPPFRWGFGMQGGWSPVEQQNGFVEVSFDFSWRFEEIEWLGLAWPFIPASINFLNGKDRAIAVPVGLLLRLGRFHLGVIGLPLCWDMKKVGDHNELSYWTPGIRAEFEYAVWGWKGHGDERESIQMRILAGYSAFWSKKYSSSYSEIAGYFWLGTGFTFWLI